MTTASASLSRGRRFALIANIVVQSMYLLSFPVWYIVSMFSVMLFDDPNADQFPPVLIFYYSLQSYPYVTVAMMAVSWLLYGKRRFRGSAWINVVPVALIIAGFLPMLIWGQ
ncbi:hypothetical protein [Paenibacillus sp. NPDC058071]|uniref:hypothetical protein n=1 Tax=Paenibacillus sp. NPDC058071 TaxID=3346326 RepID=UPI0036D953E0